MIVNTNENTCSPRPHTIVICTQRERFLPLPPPPLQLRACLVATCIFKPWVSDEFDGCQTADASPPRQPRYSTTPHFCIKKVCDFPETRAGLLQGDVALPIYPEPQRTTPPIHRLGLATQRAPPPTGSNRSAKKVSAWHAEDTNSASVIRALQEMLGQSSLMCGRSFIMQHALVLTARSLLEMLLARRLDLAVVPQSLLSTEFVEDTVA